MKTNPAKPQVKSKFIGVGKFNRLSFSGSKGISIKRTNKKPIHKKLSVRPKMPITLLDIAIIINFHQSIPLQTS